MTSKDCISIIIPVYDKIQYTTICLKAIERHTPQDIDYRIVVVDDCSIEKVEDILPGMVSNGIRDRLLILRNEKNLGFSQSINRAVREAATGDILLLLNNDVFVTEGWLEPLLSDIDRKDGDIIGSKLLYPDATIQHAGGVFYYERRHGIIMPYHLYRGFNSNFAGVNKHRRFNWVTFACVLMSRKVFDDLGGLDSAFLNGYEDVDFCLRAARKDYVVLYEPDSVAYHIEGGTRGYGNPRDAANHQLFVERHKSIRDDDFRYYIEDGVPIELGRKFSGEQFFMKLLAFPYLPDAFISVLEDGV